MILQRTLAPTVQCPVESHRSIVPAVEAMIGREGLAGAAKGITPGILDMVGLAVMEVLHTLLERCGEQRPGDGPTVELWIEPRLAVIAVSWTGPALPDWLLARWDRGDETAMFEAPPGSSWGWLLVREALDSVTTARRGGRRLLLLEKRL